MRYRKPIRPIDDHSDAQLLAALADLRALIHEGIIDLAAYHAIAATADLRSGWARVDLVQNAITALRNQRKPAPHNPR
jgi:hypothetical protein